MRYNGQTLVYLFLSTVVKEWRQLIKCSPVDINAKSRNHTFLEEFPKGIPLPEKYVLQKQKQNPHLFCILHTQERKMLVGKVYKRRTLLIHSIEFIRMFCNRGHSFLPSPPPPTSSVEYPSCAPGG